MMQTSHSRAQQRERTSGSALIVVVAAVMIWTLVWFVSSAVSAVDPATRVLDCQMSRGPDGSVVSEGC